jgi:hypothetical protein
MNNYVLKLMVLARLFAEATVLLSFILLPVSLLMLGKMKSLGAPIQALLYVLAILGLSILPWFGFLTWRVKVDQNGLTSYSLFKRQFCAWETMTKITRRASWNWQRYVIDYHGGSLHFPILLNKCNELVEIIRRRIPNGEAPSLSSEHPTRAFLYDPVAAVLEQAQAILACVFAILFWFFFAFGLRKNFQTTQDLLAILIFCLVVTAICLWRLIAVAMMPRSVQLGMDGIVLSNYFGKKSINWQEVLGTGTPFPLLPEGFTIKTKKGSYLIGIGMDKVDEMQEIITFELKGR